MTPPPLVVDGLGPAVLPAFPLPMQARGGRPLFVYARTIYIRDARGWHRIPRGYVTDFGSIPRLATWLTLTDLQPLGRHAMATGGHDWGYAIGEPGRRAAVDAAFLAQMAADGVPKVRRQVMHAAVRLGGASGYAKAAQWWAIANFADPETGAYPVAPPFPREAAFAGGPWGVRPRPDWAEPTS